MDPITGRVLESKNPHQRMFPASTTKTMTALLAIESGKLDEVFTISSNPPKTGEQSILLMQGEQFLLRDLVNAALIKSANDACVAIAEAVAGDVPTFVKMMNAKAKELGAVNTHFCNPHGLHNPNHYSTAYDLALIAQAAMRYPQFNAITRTQRAAIHGNWKVGPSRPLLNRNRLLFRWNQCDGVKTGYTRQAGRCLIASATQIQAPSKEPWRLLSVVLKSPDSWHDAQALLQYHGFARFKPALLGRAGETFGTTTVQNGGRVKAVLPQNAILTLRADEESALTRTVQWNELSAPLQAGQIVGHLDYFAHDQKVAAVPLVAQYDVPVSRLASVIPAGLSVTPSFKGLSYLSLKWPSTANLMVSGLLLLGVTLLWSGLKGGREESNEKRQQPARRAAPKHTPDRPKQAGQSARRPDEQADKSRSARPIPTTADSSRREPSARNQQPQRDAKRVPSTRNVAHSRAARQAQHSRHSAPGSIHQQRQHKSRDAQAKEPCIGEEFIARFLDEESQTATLNGEFNFESEIIAQSAPTKSTSSRW